MPSSERWTAQDVADKIDFEGGIDSVLSWGLKASMVPLPLEAHWRAMERAWAQFRLAAAAVEAGLPEPWAFDADA